MSSPLASRHRPRVVVVGGGFAGLSAVHRLRDADVDVLLVDRDLYSTFQPLLYQVATGGLNPGDVTYALRAVTTRAPNVRFRRGRMTGLDPDAWRLTIDAGDVIHYDALVLCCGVGAHFFGVPGASEHAKTIYTRREALDVRDTLFGRLEAIDEGRPGGVEPVIVVVGGGPTGVEMAGALAELRNAAMPVFYPDLDIERVRVVLVEMTDTILASFKPGLQRYALRALRRRGVELRLGTAVTEVRRDSVALSTGEILPSILTIWASGVKARDEVAGWGLPQGPGGRLRVDADMRVTGFPEIFAVGDIAASEDPLPQLAQPAIQGGRHAAEQILRLRRGLPTQPFRYRDKGTMATIGRSDALVELARGWTMTGFPAWLGWLGLHIVMLMGHRNRLATLVNLSVRYLAWPGRIDVIVGDPPPSS